MQKEIVSNGDIVVLKGKDTYINLREKTFNMMKYFSLLPAFYTHLVKIDDDVWLRPSPLINSLYESKPIDVFNELTDVQVMAIAEQIWKVDIQTFETARADHFFDPDTELIKPHGAFETSKVVHGSGFYSRSNDTDMKNQLKAWLGVRSDEIAIIYLPIFERPRMNQVYMGCVENKYGFEPIRDPSSKWFIPHHEISTGDYRPGVQYAAGWGYILSRDNVEYIASTADEYDKQGENAPTWFRKIPWEDVLVGFLLTNVTRVEHNDGFKPAWTRFCKPDTILKHLDFDSPRLLSGLVAQDRSGLSREKTIQCSSVPSNQYYQWLGYQTLVTKAAL